MKQIASVFYMRYLYEGSDGQAFEQEVRYSAGTRQELKQRPFRMHGWVNHYA